MATKADYPYDNYYIFVVYHKKERRKYAVLYPIDANGPKRTTISYARYLLSVKAGRMLAADEEVDHIDGDKSNDSIENLQILKQREHKVKHTSKATHAMVRLRCPWCGIFFDRPKRQTYLSKGGSFTACSRECSGRFGYKMFHNPNDPDVLRAIRENLVLEYRESCNSIEEVS